MLKTIKALGTENNKPSGKQHTKWISSFLSWMGRRAGERMNGKGKSTRRETYFSFLFMSPFLPVLFEMPTRISPPECVTLTDVRRLPWAIYLHHQENGKMDVWELIAVVCWKEGGLWKWEEASYRDTNRENLQRCVGRRRRRKTERHEGVRELDLCLWDDAFPFLRLPVCTFYFSHLQSWVKYGQRSWITKAWLLQTKNVYVGKTEWNSYPKKNEWVEGKQQMVSSHELFAQNSNETYLINEWTVSLLCVLWCPFRKLTHRLREGTVSSCPSSPLPFTSLPWYKWCRKKLTHVLRI